MAPSLISLLVLLSSLSHASVASKFWNIDCGAEDGFISTTNLTWIGDGEYVRTGESHTVENTTGLTTLATLRAFRKNKKNCYNIPTGEGVTIFLTVRFFYGNYDLQNQAPTFQFMFDSTMWLKVETSLDTTTSLSVMYVTKRENTSICFGRIFDDQDPFVSSIQVRTLEAETYRLRNSSFIFTPLEAVAFGSNQSFRYPYDPYDRPWVPASNHSEGFDYKILANEAPAVDVSNIIDSPPARVFEHAAVPLSGEGNLSIRMMYMVPKAFPVYLNMYFSEVLKNGTRSFLLYKDGELMSNASSPIVPPYAEVTEFSAIFDATINTTLTLVPTAESTLPPLINGMEVLWISGFSSEGTDSADVDALTVLQDKFSILQHWTGDPCLPKDYNWEWVECNSNKPSRVTALILNGYGLSGSLPDFSGLDALETIDMHNNSLTGTIPGFLAKFSSLKKLNLANNNFSGIAREFNNTKIRSFNYTGNPLLEQNVAPPPSNPSGDPTNGCNKFSVSALLIILFALATSIIA